MDINEIIEIYHTKFGHNGISSTLNTLRKYFKFNDAYKRIKNYILDCYDCYRCKGRYCKSSLNNKIYAKESFDKISVDIYGPLENEALVPDKDTLKIYIFTITDVYSRFSKIFPLERKTANQIIKCLTAWFDKFNKPRTIISDNGRQFICKELKYFLEKKEIRHVLVPEYSPNSNGISERINRTMNEVFRIYHGSQLDLIVRIIERRLNLTYNRGVKNIPQEIILKNIRVNILEYFLSEKN